MNNTIYQFVTTILVKNLEALERVVAKAAMHSKEHAIPESEILGWNLAPDMFDFKKQIQVATDDARRNLYLLAGKEHIKFEDTETTLAELSARITRTKELISTLSQDDFADADARHVSLYWMGGMYVEGKDFVQELVIQNNSFHVVTAYDILRAHGVVIGKTDYAGNLSMKK
jgi:hypothetical protein